MVPINLLGFVFDRIQPTVPERELNFGGRLKNQALNLYSGYATAQASTE